MNRRLTSVLLSLLLIFALPASSLAASLGDYPDAPAADHWSHSALSYAVDNDLLRGIDGEIAGQGQLTRAQMATVVNRAFGAVTKADISRFSDVQPNDWFYGDMAKAVQMGSLTGRSATAMAPNAPITRQEVFAIFARLLALPAGPANALSAFSDGASVAPWAKGSVAALVDAGIVGGANGMLHPEATITRAEFAALMQKAFPTIVRKKEDLSKIKPGNVLLAANIGEAKGLKVKGDLILGDGTGGNALALAGQVEGRLIARGGSPIDISELNLEQMVVHNPNGTTVLKVEKLKALDAQTPVELIAGTVESATGQAKAKEEGLILSEKKEENSDTDKDKEDKEESKDENKDKKDDKTDQNSVYYKPSTGSTSSGSGKDSKPDQPGDDVSKVRIVESDANVDLRHYPIWEKDVYVHWPYFNVYVKVYIDENNKVIKVEDNNTQNKLNHKGSKLYEKYGSEAILEWWLEEDEGNGGVYTLPIFANKEFMNGFIGLDVIGAKAKMERIDGHSGINNPDAVAGATQTCGAIAEAVYRALKANPEETVVHGRKFLEDGMLQLTAVDASKTKYTFGDTFPEGFETNIENIGAYYGFAKVDGAFIKASNWDPMSKTITFAEPLNKAGGYLITIKDISQDGLGTWRSRPLFVDISSNRIDSLHILNPFQEKYSVVDGYLKKANGESVSKEEVEAFNYNFHEGIILPEGGSMENGEDGFFARILGSGLNKAFFDAIPQGNIFISDEGPEFGKINIKPEIIKSADLANDTWSYGVSGFLSSDKTYDVGLYIWGMSKPFTFKYTPEAVTPPEPPSNDLIGKAQVKPAEGATGPDAAWSPWEIALKIELDSAGKIRSITDQSKVPGQSQLFWQLFAGKDGSGLNSRFVGKDKAGVKSLDMGTVGSPGNDAETGATISSIAAKKAVLEALAKANP